MSTAINESTPQQRAAEILNRVRDTPQPPRAREGWYEAETVGLSMNQNTPMPLDFVHHLLKTLGNPAPTTTEVK